MKPNKHRLLLWYRALKSGQYKQAIGALETISPSGAVDHCCLGVACRTAMSNGLDIPAKSVGGYTRFGVHLDEVCLPAEVAEWFGFPGSDDATGRRDPVIGLPVDGSVLQAVHANDGLRWTFDQIADSVYEYYGLAEVDSATG